MTRPGIPIFRKNLLRNSSFELGATNWGSNTIVDIGAATPADGTKVLQSFADFQTVQSDDFIEVDPTKTYIIRGWFRHSSGAGVADHYFGVACYDAGKNFIAPIYTNVTQSTETTLAADVHVGDTTISLTSAANWIASVNSHCMFNTKDDGSDLPNRSVSSGVSSIVGNVLHLTGTAGFAFPAGTKVRMSEDSGTFTYAGAQGGVTPTVWTEFVGAINGLQLPYGGEGNHTFRPGTKYVTILALLNYGVSGTVTQMDAVQFYPEEQAGAQAQSELVHLMEMEFSDGIIRLATSAADLTTEPYAIRVGQTASRYLIRNPVLPAWPTTAVTVEFWGKLDIALGASSSTRFAAVDYVLASSRELGFGIRNNSGWQHFVSINGSDHFDTLTGVADDQLWHHYVMTWVSATGTVMMYRDGIHIHTATGFKTGASISAAGALVIGNAQNTQGSPDGSGLLAWDGDLDDVRVYQRVLSASEVTDHFNRRFANEASICVNYRFDTPYQLGRDSSINAQHAKAVGMTAPVVVTGADLVAKTWQAVGGNLEIGGVQETPDTKGQGVELSIDGVDQTVLAALLDTQWRGRPVRLFRAHFDFELGGIAADIMLLFKGYQLNAYTVEENLDRGGGTVSLKTRIIGYFALDRIMGIQSNLVSHQHYFPGDTFFQNVTQLANTKIYWGTPVAQTPGRGGQSFGGGTSGTDINSI